MKLIYSIVVTALVGFQHAAQWQTFEFEFD